MWDDVKHFWSDEDDADYRTRTKSAAVPAKKTEHGFTHTRMRHEIITSYNTATHVSIHALASYRLELDWSASFMHALTVHTCFASRWLNSSIGIPSIPLIPSPGYDSIPFSSF